MDKSSRVPPLEAPIKPQWLGVESFQQTGMVSAQTSFKIAPLDESTLKKIDRLRRVSGELLPRYSFALADGIRWMPLQVIPLFEAALTAASEDAKALLGKSVGADIDAFLTSQRDRIRADVQRMFENYHSGAKISEATISDIVDELKTRLGKASGEALIPRVSYSPVAFHPGVTTKWSSPWGQAFQLVKGIVAYPREAMTDQYFWRGIRTDQDALVNAMNVAGDYLVANYGSSKARKKAEAELAIVKSIDAATSDLREKCEALWGLIKQGDDKVAKLLLAKPAVVQASDSGSIVNQPLTP